MSKIISSFAGLFLFVMLSTNLCHSQGKVFFDVKTKFAEKSQLAVVKAGTEVTLIQSGWAGVVEYGADYALWLRNYTKNEEDDVTSIEITIELRKPAGFSEGKLLDSRKVNMSWRINEVREEVDTSIEAIMRQLKTDSRKVIAEATVVGERVAEEARQMAARVR